MILPVPPKPTLAHWPTQIADALRGLIHQANLARDSGRDTLDAAVRDKLIKQFADGVPTV